MASKPGGVFGVPSRFAHEQGPDQDLHEGDVPDIDEEQDDEQQDGDERPDDMLTSLYRGMRDGQEKAVHVATGIANCLQHMAHSASRGDSEGLTRWFHQCYELGDSLDDED